MPRSPTGKTKGEKTREQLIVSATICLANSGDRKTTFQAIADEAGVSQSLVVKHFKNRENIFPEVISFWIRLAREKTESTLIQSGSPDEKMRNYIRVSFEIYQLRPELPKILLLLHAFAGTDDKYRSVNTEIKKIATERLAAIIQEGQMIGAFRQGDPMVLAKSVHNALIGLLLSNTTEFPFVPQKELLPELERMALQFLK